MMSVGGGFSFLNCSFQHYRNGGCQSNRFNLQSHFIKLMLYYPQINKKGETVPYWTHSSYLDQFKLQNLQLDLASKSRFALGLSCFAGFVGTNFVHKGTGSPLAKLPMWGTFLAIGGVVYVLTKLQSSYYRSSRMSQIMSQASLPLWKHKERVINIDRIFFDLNDTKNNQPNILYNGLSAERAEHMFPDLVVGPPPKMPEPPHVHH